ncbi:CatB-related O-acetyltransferase [Pseudomonas mosselii]|uniref:CatB-related O-acetyltransferase n=2 Tax=Pseudomonas mosselii TaxID=78327 RepID=A0A5R8Z894_9PSED|nr:CatB-related O-acetyltransferase [Pseudomonas mosselii]
MLRRIDYLRRGIRVARGSYVERGVKIGNYTRINHVSHLGVCQIGSYCAIGGRLVVRSTNHHVKYLNMQDWAQVNIIKSTVPVAGKGKGEVIIGHGVWIGDSVVILPGVTVGNGAVIGAGSVVTRPIPAYAIAVGNPARVVKYRFCPEVIALLEAVDWWSWSVEKIQRNRDIFELDFQVIEPVQLREKLENIR